jgi:3-hydroxyacyl-[acyl-carrier-protein] dehydratase
MQLDMQGILAAIPHRYPFLLVDRILEIEPGERILGLKNVTANEPFFPGHFPQYPVMPGVLIVEGLAQTGAVLMLHDAEPGQIPFFAGIDKARFRRQVVPGDQLLLDVQVLQQRPGTCRLQGTARVGDEVAAQAEILAIARSDAS